MHFYFSSIRVNWVAFVLTCLVLKTGSLAQNVPTLINYQGQIQDAKGAPLSTADYALSLSLFDAASGGKLVWGPQLFDGQTSAGHGLKVPVVQGYFNVMLGPVDVTGAVINTAFDQANRFLEIKVGDGPPISPRQQILSTPFAFRATFAESAGKAAQADVASTALKATRAEVADRATVAETVANAGAAETSKFADQAKDALKLAGFDWSALFGVNDPIRGLLPGNRLVERSLSIEKLAPRLIGTNLADVGGIAFSEPTGDGIYDSVTATEIPVKNLSVALITSGRPVLVFLSSAEPISPGVNSDDGVSLIYVQNIGLEASVNVNIYRFNKLVSRNRLSWGVGAPGFGPGFVFESPPSSIQFVDNPPKGTNSYSVTINGISRSVRFRNVRLVAFEL